MTKTKLSFTVAIAAILVLSNGCALLGGGVNDEDAVMQVMIQYKEGMEQADADIVLPLLADDYSGFRGSGKDRVAQRLERMAESDERFQLDLEQASVTVNGDTALVSDVGSKYRQWESMREYTLVKTDDGWKIQGSERYQ